VPSKVTESKWIPEALKDKIGTCPETVSCACQEKKGWFGRTYKACGKVDQLLKLEALLEAEAVSAARESAPTLRGSEETEFLRKCEEDSDCACVDLKDEAEGGEYCVPSKVTESKWIPEALKDKIGTCPETVSCACQEKKGWFGKTYKSCGKAEPSPSPEEAEMLYHHLLKLEAQAVSAARESAPTLRGSEETEFLRKCEEDSDCACVDIKAEAEGGEYCVPSKITESKLIPDKLKDKIGTCPDTVSCACQEKKGWFGKTYKACAKAA